MAVRNEDLETGASNFVDEALKPSDLNDTFSAVHQFQTSEGTTDISNGTTFADMDDMDITISAAGTYLVIFSASVRADDYVEENSLSRFKFLKNGSDLIKATVGTSQNTTEAAGQDNFIVNMTHVETFAASDVIKVQWEASNGNIYNEASSGNYYRRIVVYRLGS